MLGTLLFLLIIGTAAWLYQNELIHFFSSLRESISRSFSSSSTSGAASSSQNSRYAHRIVAEERNSERNNERTDRLLRSPGEGGQQGGRRLSAEQSNFLSRFTSLLSPPSSKDEQEPLVSPVDKVDPVSTLLFYRADEAEQRAVFDVECDRHTLGHPCDCKDQRRSPKSTTGPSTGLADEVLGAGGVPPPPEMCCAPAQRKTSAEKAPSAQPMARPMGRNTASVASTVADESELAEHYPGLLDGINGKKSASRTGTKLEKEQAHAAGRSNVRKSSTGNSAHDQHEWAKREATSDL